jgi:hypothetical protein
MSYKIVLKDCYADKDSIIQFWNANNKKKLDEKYAWFYESNPDGAANVWLVKHEESNETVGMGSLFPRRFQFGNQIVNAAVHGDFFIHSNHRSFGPALMLIRAIARSIVDLNYDFIYGFPNIKAEPIIKYAGYTRLGQTRKYTRLFKVDRLLHEKLSIPIFASKILGPISSQFLQLLYPDSWIFNFGRYRTNVTRRLDSDIDTLLDAYRHTCYTTFKSQEYLNWKYADDPDDENFFFTIHDKNGQIAGCIAYCHSEQNTIAIREILHPPDHRKLYDLLALFFKYAVAQNAEYAYVQLYENSYILTQHNNLDLFDTNEGQSIYYLINPQHEQKERLQKLIKSPRLNLYKTDQDT